MLQSGELHYKTSIDELPSYPPNTESGLLICVDTSTHTFVAKMLEMLVGKWAMIPSNEDRCDTGFFIVLSIRLLSHGTISGQGLVVHIMKSKIHRTSRNPALIGCTEQVYHLAPHHNSAL